MSDDEDQDPEEQLRVAAEFGQALLRQNEQLQRDNAALRLEVADGAAHYGERMRQQEAVLVEPLQRRVEELEDTVAAGEAMRLDQQKLLAERDGQLEKRDGTDDQLREELSSAIADGEANAAQLAQAEAQLATTMEENYDQMHRLEQALSTGDANRAAVAELQEQFALMTAERDQKVAELRTAREDVGRAGEALGKEKAERNSLVELLEEAGVATQRVVDEHAAMRGELVAARAENAALQTKIDSMDLMLDSMNTILLGDEVAAQGSGNGGGGGGAQGGAAADEDGGGSLGAELERDAEQDRVDVETKMLVLKSWVSALVMERDDLLVETVRLKQRVVEAAAAAGMNSSGGEFTFNPHHNWTCKDGSDIFACAYRWLQTTDKWGASRRRAVCTGPGLSASTVPPLSRLKNVRVLSTLALLFFTRVSFVVALQLLILPEQRLAELGGDAELLLRVLVLVVRHGGCESYEVISTAACLQHATNEAAISVGRERAVDLPEICLDRRSRGI